MTEEVGRRVGQRWQTCMRCGKNFPNAMMIVQNGLLVCYGPNTSECRDEPGAAAFRRGIFPGYEMPDPDPPITTEDL